MARIDIVEAGGAVTFEPPDLTLRVGEAVFFRNMDKTAEHWITMVGGADNLWFPRPLGANTGKRPRTTRLLGLVALTATTTITYRCVLHPGETGTITLTAAGP